MQKQIAIPRPPCLSPKGSTFTFTFPDDFTTRDREEIAETAELLRKHGYKVEWASLRLDPAQ
jgi:hypothetical protein